MSQSPNHQQKLRSAALRYAAKGWRVFPLFGISQGECECGHRDCSAPGKHPRVPGGVKTAVTDEGQIKRWWNHFSNSNVGIATGSSSGLLVVDVDGKTGKRNLKALNLGPDVFSPLTAITGKGWHYYFEYDGTDVRNSAGKLGDGIDIRGEGGYVVAPPSMHKSGNRYRWLDAGAEIVSLPGSLRTLLAGSPSVQQETANLSLISEGLRNSTLTSIAGAMRRKAASKRAILAALRVENRHRCVPPLPEEEVLQIARSIARYTPADATRDWPKPMGQAAHFGLAGHFVRMVAPHSEADEAALLVQFLVAFGNCINRRPFFSVEASRHHTNLFCALVGDTSKGRKGTAWGRVLETFRWVDPEWTENNILEGLSSGEGLISAVQNDATQGEHEQDKRLLVVETEFASTLRVMGRTANILGQTIRQAWDTGKLSVLTRNSPLKATGAHISIIAHITKSELAKELNKTDLFNGFANRFLWVCTRRSKSLPHGGHVPAAELRVLMKRLKKAYEFGLKAQHLRFSQQARRLWEEYYAGLSEGRDGLCGAVVSRAEAQVIRIASLYALLDSSSLILHRHLEGARALWQYCEDSVDHIFSKGSRRSVATRIFEFLQGCSAGATRSQISGFFSNHLIGTELEDSLNSLLAQRLVRCEKRGTEGRPAEKWYAVEGK